MNDRDQETDRKILQALSDELSQEIASVSVADGSISPDNAIGRLTRMEAIQSQAMSSAGRERLRRRLQAVERALEAVEDGTYGVCVHCGGAIAQGRLSVVPETRACVPCAQRRR